MKALAVATRNPYIQIYKPILLLALEDYFSTPSVTVLARLYNAINSIEATTLPYLSLDERSILRTSDRKDMFEEKFGLVPSAGAGGGQQPNEVRRMTSDMSFSTKKSSSDDVEIVGGGGGGSNGRYSNNPILADDDSSIAEVLSPASTSISTGNMFPPSSSSTNANNPRSRSSGSISSIASLSKLPSRPPSSAAQTTNASMEDLSTSTSFNGSQSRSRANTMTSSEGGGDGFTNLQRDFMYSSAANHPLPTSSSTYNEHSSPIPGRRSLPPPGPSAGKPKDTHWYETKVGYGGINLPIRIPLGTFPSEIGDVSLTRPTSRLVSLDSEAKSTLFECAVLSHQPDPNLLLSTLSRPFFDPPPFPPHIRFLNSPHNPPLQRPRDFAPSSFPRTWSSSWKSSRPSIGCLCTR